MKTTSNELAKLQPALGDANGFSFTDSDVACSFLHFAFPRLVSRRKGKCRSIYVLCGFINLYSTLGKVRVYEKTTLCSGNSSFGG